MLPEAPWNSEGIHSFTYLIKKKKKITKINIHFLKIGKVGELSYKDHL